MVAGERETLAGWLDFYRATLAQKCAGLADAQLRTVAVPPSSLTLLGLVQHMAEVERNWFRRILADEHAPPIYSAGKNADGHDGGFDITDGSSYADAEKTWTQEVEQARANCAGRALDDTCPFAGGEVTLRWIYVHMISEYARHCGHADLIRERIDGTTGV